MRDAGGSVGPIDPIESLGESFGEAFDEALGESFGESIGGSLGARSSFRGFNSIGTGSSFGGVERVPSVRAELAVGAPGIVASLVDAQAASSPAIVA